MFAYLRGLMELRVKMLAKTGSGELVPLGEVGHGWTYLFQGASSAPLLRRRAGRPEWDAFVLAYDI